MATNIFHSMQKLALTSWAKFTSFFKAKLDDEQQNDSDTLPRIPNTKFSADHPEGEGEPELDLEAGLQFQPQEEEAADHPFRGPFSIPSPTPINSTPQKGLNLPISIRPSVPSFSSSHSLPLSNNNIDNSESQEGLNTVAKIFKERELGKVVMGFVMPLTTAFVGANAPDSLLLKTLVVLSLCVGLAAILIGILLQNTSQRYAIKIEQVGAAFVVFAVYAWITSFLPLYLQWIPWGCFLMIVLLVGGSTLSSKTKLIAA